jgi:large subunit ribosomal protein L6
VEASQCFPWISFRLAPKGSDLSIADCCFKELELVGVGYRAAVNERDLVMSLGYSHPVVLKIPEGITVKVERNVRVTIAGYDRQLIGRFCANIRDQRRPEPYKGKGIRYADEIIVKKVGKKK